MPRITIGKQDLTQLSTGLQTYRRELEEMIAPIREAARFAARRPEEYIPQDLSDELKITEGCLRYVTNIHGDDIAQVIGVDIPPEYLQLMASALALRREDLAARLRGVSADPLMPSEAASPLRDEIDRIDGDMARFWHQWGEARCLPLLRERRLRKLGLAFPTEISIDAALADGEGQAIEFIESFPKQTHDLAKEIAAFGTSNPGTIFLGITNAGVVRGVEHVETLEERDKLRQRVEGNSSNGIVPSLAVRVKFQAYKETTVCVVQVPKGAEPLYQTGNGATYVRHGSLSRPAVPAEINELVRRHLERQQAK